MMINKLYNMSKKIIFSILISIFLISVLSLCLIQPAASSYYYEPAGLLYGDDFYYSDYFEDTNSNSVVVEFNNYGSFSIDVSSSDNTYELADKLSECIYKQIDDPNANITTLKDELSEICKNNGISSPEITITSPYGEDMFIFTSKANGISMNPTIRNGQLVIVNKTHDVHVGDLVAAKYPSEHGGVIKRVAEIRGDELYIISDNVNGSYLKNGELYEYEGLRTWVNMSDILGVVIDIRDSNEAILV